MKEFNDEVNNMILISLDISYVASCVVLVSAALHRRGRR